MKFDYPRILFFLWAVLPLAGIMIYAMVKRKRILGRFAGKDMLPFLVSGRRPGIVLGRMALILIAIVLGLFALAQPKSGFHWEKVSSRGVDILIALDCSRSMLAQDVKPSRLERAKREIFDLISLMKADKSKTDRAGLVAFAGNAFLQCPLTLDYQGFGIFLRTLSPDVLPLGGTNLNAALETCASAFDPASDTDKAIVLITDGENTQGQRELESIVKKLADQEIRIFAVGIGNVHGAPVPKASGGFVKDSDGSIVMSKVDEVTLKNICARTKGYYVRSVAGNMDLDEIYTKRIAVQMDQKEFEQGRKKVGIPRFQWFLLPCVLLLFLEWVMDFFHGRVRKKRKKSHFPTLIVCFLWAGFTAWLVEPDTVFSGNLVEKGIQKFQAGEFERAKHHFMEAQRKDPDDPRLNYNIGTAAYKYEEYDLALDNFQRAAQSPDPKLQHLAKYNMGNAFVQKGDLEKAREILEEVVADFPEDEQAKDNLAWVEKKLKEREQQKQDQSQRQGRNQENQDSSDQDESQDKSSSQKNSSQDQESSNQQPDNQPNKQSEQSPGQQSHQGTEEKGNQNQDQPQEQDSRQDQNGNETDHQERNQGQGRNQDHGQDGHIANQSIHGGEKGESGGQTKSPPQDGDAAFMDAKLNRLQDRPGFALMPPARGKPPEKDW